MSPRLWMSILPLPDLTLDFVSCQRSKVRDLFDCCVDFASQVLDFEQAEGEGGGEEMVKVTLYAHVIATCWHPHPLRNTMPTA